MLYKYTCLVFDNKKRILYSNINDSKFPFIKARIVFNNKNKKVMLMRRIIALFFLAVFLCGCSSENIADNVLGAISISANDREAAIEENIELIEGISSAVVAVRGNAALIGLVLEREYAEKSNELKTMAAAVARQTDISIKSTAVTCNAEITSMIKNLKKASK